MSLPQSYALATAVLVDEFSYGEARLGQWCRMCGSDARMILFHAMPSSDRGA